jgi:hypothetical protein
VEVFGSALEDLSAEIAILEQKFLLEVERKKKDSSSYHQQGGWRNNMN